MKATVNLNQVLQGGLAGLVAWLFKTVNDLQQEVATLNAQVTNANERLAEVLTVISGISGEITEIIWRIGGGGSLSLFYQSEAENPSITETPAGDPINLIDEKFIPADGIMLIAAHESRHRTFTEWIDGSVINEIEPENRDIELDIYNSENPNQPTYSQEFLDTYRKAQIERNRRITCVCIGIIFLLI